MSAISRKPGEVVRSSKRVRGGAEGFVIERPAYMPRATDFKRRQHGCRRNAITISLPSSREPRVESPRDDFRARHAYLRRKRSVQRREQNSRRQTCCRQIDVRALPERMHASIGPARAVHTNFLPQYLEESRFKPFLNRVAARLDLPTGETGAKIRDD